MWVVLRWLRLHVAWSTEGWGVRPRWCRRYPSHENGRKLLEPVSDCAVPLAPATIFFLIGAVILRMLSQVVWRAEGWNVGCGGRGWDSSGVVTLLVMRWGRCCWQFFWLEVFWLWSGNLCMARLWLWRLFFTSLLVVACRWSVCRYCGGPRGGDCQTGGRGWGLGKGSWDHADVVTLVLMGECWNLFLILLLPWRSWRFSSLLDGVPFRCPTSRAVSVATVFRLRHAETTAACAPASESGRDALGVARISLCVCFVRMCLWR